MLKEHPKGLVVAFFANMGERFGFYTMMAILVLFLQAKYGLDEDGAGWIYGIFYFSIYALALVGGFVADRFAGLNKTIFIGILTMVFGYIIMSIPGFGLSVSVVALLIIAFGNGLFKGNLQALVGNLYEEKKYRHLRDSAFSIFYMGINIGAFFAPSAATGMRNFWLKTNAYKYDGSLPEHCHNFINANEAGKSIDSTLLQSLADKVSLNGQSSDLLAFAHDYINVFSTGYHYAFGIAAVAMVVSMIVYILFKKYLLAGDILTSGNKIPETMKPMSKSQEKERLIALGLVFLTVIFFWMSFHQNGLTLTYFARDYTNDMVSNISFLFFDLKTFIPIIAVIIGIVLLIKKGTTKQTKIIVASLIPAGVLFGYYFFSKFSSEMQIEPELFAQFNPIFIVFLTPIVVALFQRWNQRGIEPSSPKKIGIGMFLASFGFVLLLAASLGLTSPAELGDDPSPERVSEYWLVTTYFILTVAELFLSPMGISFVSKVAPPRFKGLMQGGWLAATALGNLLIVVGSTMWLKIEIWQVWLIFVVCTSASGAFIFSILKRLEKVTGDSDKKIIKEKTTNE